MIEWSASATARLEDYFKAMRKRLENSGADENEVVEDLRRHVNEEIHAMKLVAVTEQDVGQILLKIGAPEPFPVEGARSGPGRTPDKPARRLHLALLFFGVLLPLGTVIFEFITGVCAAELFDPIPSLVHLLIVLAVPIINFAGWHLLRTGTVGKPKAMGFASGFAIAVSAVYGLLLIPFMPIALIGILVYGLGLVPLAPAGAFIAGALLHSRLSDLVDGGLRFWARGALAGAAALLLASLPMFLTQAGLQMAISTDKAKSTRGVGWLRTLGSNEELLRECYGRRGELGNLYRLGERINPEQARELYFRVTGKPFNSVPPPKLYAGRARWSAAEEQFTWDNDRGGDTVGGCIRGLSAKSSRIDGTVDPANATAYFEWTLDFANVSGVQREARAQIQLPAGGVVSRVTLWIDGEEREAAFGGRSQVKTAYRQVVQQRRDPVLITTCGPDRVLLQCFPVPPNGGTMKARLGITVPIELASETNGMLQLPRFLERNFTLPEGFQHSVWVESKQLLASGSGRLIPDRTKGGGFGLRGVLSNKALENRAAGLDVALKLETSTRAIDVRNGERYEIEQRLQKTHEAAADALVVVLDGNAGMSSAYRALGEAIKSVPDGTKVAVLLAKDGVEDISEGAKTITRETVAELAGRIGRPGAKGGHDNIPALVRAWDIAAQYEHGRIFWIHGPQPVLLEEGEDLRQRLQRRPDGPRIFELEITVGPNRILERLDGLGVHSLSRTGDLGADLKSALQEVTGGRERRSLSRTRRQEPGGAAAGETSGSKDIVRLWAAEETARLAARRMMDAATTLGQQFQIVTPLTGAVVLETKAQYAQAGLQPAAPESVPTIPEPGTVSLLLFGGAAFWARRKMIGRKTRYEA